MEAKRHTFAIVKTKLRFVKDSLDILSLGEKRPETVFLADFSPKYECKCVQV